MVKNCIQFLLLFPLYLFFQLAPKLLGDKLVGTNYLRKELLGISFGYRHHENITEILTGSQNGNV